MNRMINPLDRREYLGSHAICVILHPDDAYRSPAELYAFYTEGFQPKVPAELQRKWDDSHIFEPIILRRYAERHSKRLVLTYAELPERTIELLTERCRVYDGDKGQTHIRHKRNDLSHFGMTLDALEIDKADRPVAIVDAKCVWNWREADQWHDGTGRVPMKIRTQMAWGAFLTGIPYATIVAKQMTRDGKEEVYTLETSFDDADAVGRNAYAWWRDHVLARVEPDHHFGKHYNAILAERLPKIERSVIEEANADLHEAGIAYGRAQHEAAIAEKRRKDAGNYLKHLHQGFEESPVATLKPNKNGVPVLNLKSEYKVTEDEGGSDG